MAPLDELPRPMSTPHLRPVSAPTAAPDEPPAPGNGVTPPRRRGRGGRFLTDVIVDLGLADRERVDAAIEAARVGGKTPESVLVESGILSSEGLSRAIAERYGLDHLDLAVFNADMTAANLISSSAAKRYEAVPVAFLGE